MSDPKFPLCSVGDRYGRLLVLELISMPKNARALCRCDCGKEVTRQRGSLVRGKAVSCGCIETEKSPLALLLAAITIETDDCIPSPMKANVNGGYGTLRYKGKNERAHRVAYAHANSVEISSIGHLDIMHSCDNPPCINPRHLVAGTHTDNMRDMFSKGRRIAAVGERASKAKLTEKDVRDIRMRIRDGESNSSIAADYPVKANAINYIRIGKTWSHLA